MELKEPLSSKKCPPHPGGCEGGSVCESDFVLEVFVTIVPSLRVVASNELSGVFVDGSLVLGGGVIFCVVVDVVSIGEFEVVYFVEGTAVKIVDDLVTEFCVEGRVEWVVGEVSIDGIFLLVVVRGDMVDNSLGGISVESTASVLDSSFVVMNALEGWVGEFVVGNFVDTTVEGEFVGE